MIDSNKFHILFDSLIEGDPQPGYDYFDELFEFHHPQTIFFGALPEQRKQDEIVISVDSYDYGKGRAIEMLKWVIPTLECGISVKILDSEYEDKELLGPEIELLNACYGVMVQHCCKHEDRAEDDAMLPLGMLTVSGYNESFKITNDIGRKFINPIHKRLEEARFREPQAWMQEDDDFVNEVVPILFPAAALCMVQSSTNKFYRPFINFDLLFGGKAGWHRLVSIFNELSEDVNIDDSFGKRESEAIEEKLSQIEEFMEKMDYIIEDNYIKTVIKVRVEGIRSRI